MSSQGDGDRTVASNRRARHEYEILETVEAGLVLRGTEVKALRAGLVNFKDAYATVRNDSRLTGKVAERGLTLIPLRIYFKQGRAKLEIGLARGKKLHDKRSTLREREVRREMDRAARGARRGQW
ncbi:MAG: hypothetical protein AUG80_06960 [Candidatus Rokubacteria bacterium 13_1_20CM_4_68_9]|nr:MAG: hypothetical protein AUG80_06960 [Candidatus Rokubacteria bacterium 13_1_20CM_4_68_9]